MHSIDSRIYMAHFCIWCGIIIAWFYFNWWYLVAFQSDYMLFGVCQHRKYYSFGNWITNWNPYQIDDRDKLWMMLVSPFSPLRFISADIATCCCFSFSLSNSLLPLFQIKSLDCVGSFCNILGETISAQSTLLCSFPPEFSANAQVQRLVALRYETGMVFVLCVFFFRFWVGIQEIKDAIKLQSFFSTKLELSSMIHHKCRTI